MHAIRVRSFETVVGSAGLPFSARAFRIPSFALFVRFVVSPNAPAFMNFLSVHCPG